ncbi:unnamed protein product, partial [Allacma fusca]
GTLSSPAYAVGLGVTVSFESRDSWSSQIGAGCKLKAQLRI